MSERDQDVDLKGLYKKRICPNCHKSIPEGKGVGTGRIADGLFCDLDCYADFYQSELMQKTKVMSHKNDQISSTASNRDN